MKRTAPTAALTGLVLSSALMFLSPADPASAGFTVQVTGRGSTLPGSVEPASKGDSNDVMVSGNGRYLVFSSTARLASSDTDTMKDVYVKDLLTESVERVNVTLDGAQANGNSRAGAISPDGRYVAYWSYASNLVSGDTLNKADVFVRDRTTDKTERVSVSSTEQQANGSSPFAQDDSIDISSDGRYVTFTSSSTNLGADADTVSDVFVRDRTNGTTELITVNSAEASTTLDSYNPSLSADGRYVAFESDDTTLVASDTNSGRDIFVRDRQNGGNTYRVSLHDNDSQAAGQSFRPWISDDGAKVAFASNAKLSAIDPNNTTDVYVRDRTANTTTVQSVGSDGWAAGNSTQPTISGNGSVVAFQSTSGSFNGANGWEHIYLRYNNSSTARASVSSANVVVSGESSNPSLSTNGQVSAFDSKSNGLVTNDTGNQDVFFRRHADIGPFNSVTTFMNHQVGDFGGTAAPLVAAFNNGSSPEHTVTSLAYAPSFAGKRPQVIRLYAAYFGRLPDKAGLAYWVGKLNAGKKLDDVSASFAASNEFKTKYGNTTNSQFVTLVYQNVLNRAPDAGGLSYWVTKLNGGTSRGTVMTNFSESSEGKRVFQPRVTATLLGLGMLLKVPTGTLLTSMLAAGADSPEAVARVMLDSVDYADAVD